MLRPDAEGRVPGTGLLGDYAVAAPVGTAEVALDQAGPVDVEVRLG